MFPVLSLNHFKIHVLCLCFLSYFQTVLSLSAAEPPSSPQDVWANFDPSSLPLDVQVVKTWSEKGADYTSFFFTALIEKDRPVRVYAIYSAPQGEAKFPAILHVHGGGQTVDLRWLAFWNARGYAAMTIDWYGKKSDRSIFTDWGPFPQGNLETTGNSYEAIIPSPTTSSWYLWAAAVRRALTFLEKQPQVDPNRIGLFGVSMGGTITWVVSGMDRRLKAACAIYGAGWNTYPVELDEPDIRAADEKTRLWRKLMEPEVYAPLIQCPILYLSSTNDHWGKMDWVFRTLDQVKTEHRFAFTPYYMHHIDEAVGNDLGLWMDTWVKGDGHKWPSTPEVSISLGAGGVPEFGINPAEANDVKGINIYYAIENCNPKSRHWREVSGTSNNGKWTALLPVIDIKQPIFVYSNVTYKSGIVLGSKLLQVVPADLGTAQATDSPSLQLSDFTKGLSGWVERRAQTDPLPHTPLLIEIARGPGGIPGISPVRANQLRTWIIGDPKWRGHDGAKLEFKIYTTQSREITVSLFESSDTQKDKDGTAFVKKLTVPASSTWQTILLASEEFSTSSGKALQNWQTVRALALESNGESPQPIYTEFRWN